MIPPTICIDCRYLNGRPSGIAECVSALVQYLPKLAPDWRFVFLKSPGFDGSLSAAPNVEEKLIRAAANGPGTAWWLPRLVDLSGVNLYHSPANILPRGLQMPCVTTIHDIMWLTDPQLCDARFAGIVDRWFYASGIRHALRKSAAIGTVSMATRSEILHHGLAAPGRVHVTRSGVSEAFKPVKEQSESLRERIGDRHFRYILVVGQNAPYKNQAGAVRAFHAAFANAPDMHLVIVQRRVVGGALDALIQDLGLATRVHQLGPRPLAELIALYSHAQLLLHPSFCEGFGNPLLEAMACGCPVVTSDRSAMPEVTGDAALLVNPEDIGAIAQAISTVVLKTEKAEAMRTAGLERAAQFKWRKFAKDNLQVYCEVLAF